MDQPGTDNMTSTKQSTTRPWGTFPRHWPFVRGIHRTTVDFPRKGQWRRALMFSWICAYPSGWASSQDDGDLRLYRSNYDATAMNYILGNTIWYICMFEKYILFLLYTICPVLHFMWIIQIRLKTPISHVLVWDSVWHIPRYWLNQAISASMEDFG